VVDLDPNCGDMQILPVAMIHHDRFATTLFLLEPLSVWAISAGRVVLCFHPWLFVVIRLGYPCEPAT
jgi:hypothetical protein